MRFPSFWLPSHDVSCRNLRALVVLRHISGQPNSIIRSFPQNLWCSRIFIFFLFQQRGVALFLAEGQCVHLFETKWRRSIANCRRTKTAVGIHVNHNLLAALDFLQLFEACVFSLYLAINQMIRTLIFLLGRVLGLDVRAFHYFDSMVLEILNLLRKLF